MEEMKELIIEKYGKPNTIITDPGKEFINESVKNFLDRENIKRIYSPPYIHERSGCIERVIRTFQSKLRKLANFL